MRALTSSFVEAAGLMAAALTTACWIPQAARTIRTRETHGLSLPTYVALFAGNSLWLVYGLFIMSWPLIGANLITVPLVAVILALKLRHG